MMTVKGLEEIKLAVMTLSTYPLMIITCATVDSDRVPQLCFSNGPSTAGRNVEMVSPDPPPGRSVQFPTKIRAAIIKTLPAVNGKRIISFIFKACCKDLKFGSRGEINRLLCREIFFFFFSIIYVAVRLQANG